MKVCEGSISSRYGYRVHPVTGERNSFHNGVDIAAPIGTPVFSPVDGVITDVSESETGGKRIAVTRMGMEYIFLHLSQQNVNKGSAVQKNTVIGKVGATGRVTGPHLHFSVKAFGQYVDPSPYILID